MEGVFGDDRMDLGTSLGCAESAISSHPFLLRTLLPCCFPRGTMRSFLLETKMAVR